MVLPLPRTDAEGAAEAARVGRGQAEEPPPRPRPAGPRAPAAAGEPLPADEAQLYDARDERVGAPPSPAAAARAPMQQLQATAAHPPLPMWHSESALLDLMRAADEEAVWRAASEPGFIGGTSPGRSPAAAARWPLGAGAAQPQPQPQPAALQAALKSFSEHFSSGSNTLSSRDEAMPSPCRGGGSMGGAPHAQHGAPPPPPLPVPCFFEVPGPALIFEPTGDADVDRLCDGFLRHLNGLLAHRRAQAAQAQAHALVAALLSPPPRAGSGSVLMQPPMSPEACGEFAFARAQQQAHAQRFGAPHAGGGGSAFASARRLRRRRQLAGRSGDGEAGRRWKAAAAAAGHGS